MSHNGVEKGGATSWLGETDNEKGAKMLKTAIKRRSKKLHRRKRLIISALSFRNEHGDRLYRREGQRQGCKR